MCACVWGGGGGGDVPVARPALPVCQLVIDGVQRPPAVDFDLDPGALRPVARRSLQHLTQGAGRGQGGAGGESGLGKGLGVDWGRGRLHVCVCAHVGGHVQGTHRQG